MSEQVKNRFSFLCPEGRVDEAKVLLKETLGDRLRLSPSNALSERLTFGQDGNIKITQGRNVSGIYRGDPTDGTRNKIVDLLADSGIAGYSRETQILFCTRRNTKPLIFDVEVR